MTDSSEHSPAIKKPSAAQKDGPLETRLSRYIRTARIWLFWERYVPVFLLAALIIGLFLIGVFSGLWERIGDPWRGIAFIGALYVLVRAAYTAQKRPLPSISDAKRRVERDSGQRHRPLDVLDDQPAIGAEGWSAHYERAVSQSKSLNSPKLIPTVQPRDPYYLRYALPVMIAGAMIMGSGNNMERLRRSVLPVWQSGINPAEVSFEAWIDPPDYTGRPPIYFKGQDIDSIPEGSEWVARMNGAKTPTRPQLRLGGKSHYLRLTKLGPKSFEARAAIDRSGEAIWRIGSKRQTWPLNVVADSPPNVTLEGVPEADKQDRLVVTYSLEDDYGVTELRLQMAEIQADSVDPFAQSSSITIPLSSGSLPKAENVETKQDLTRHPLAGKKVIARLVAVDGANQTAFSDETYFRVPDKIFVEPLAKAVIEQRNLVLSAIDTEYAPEPKTLNRAGIIYDTYQPEMRLERAPENIERAALLIEAVTDRPEGLFQDPTVYLGLRNVRARLRYAREASVLAPIPDELWSIALRAEFGILGTALEEMREAEVALREGMARRAPQREIDTLFERYNRAVEAYTEELRRQALEEGNFAEGGNGGGGGLQSTDEIEELLKAIEEANRAGDVEGARRALAQLAEVLENMKIQLSQSQGGGDGEGMQGEMSEEMKENLEELADLLGEQRELQDETEESQRNAEQEGGDGENSALSPGELAARQEQLQDLLTELGEDAEKFGLFEDDNNSDNEAIAGQDGENDSQTGGGSEQGDEGDGAGRSESAEDALSRAQEAMSGAAGALRNGDLEQAGDAQAEAIQALRQAGQSMAEAALARSGQQNAENGEESDPLGRENGGANSEDSDIDIDNRDNAQRSRELMEELRRRAAEQDRAQEERDYLERLLKRF